MLPAMSVLPQLARAESQFVYQKESLYFVAQPKYSVDLERLLDACPDPTDTDGDGLPDRVEKILGTDPELTDSDFDRLDDYYEAEIGLDPLSPDSNKDGLSDYIEEKECSNRDFDGDGLPNAWDGDNDNDGVYDPLDLSPFACSIAKPSFRFHVHTTGKPMYINIQVRPRDPKHLRLPFQYFDWVDGDDKGTMQDRDNSKKDVCITPVLEVSASSLPNSDDLDKYGIYVIDGKAYVPLYTTDHFGSPSAFNGRIYYPADWQDRDITLDARLIWMVTGKTDQGLVAPGDDAYYQGELGANDSDSMGGGMAMGDINGNGRPDMVFTAVEAGETSDSEDSLSYLIGWDINSAGQPTSWSEKKSILSGGKHIQGADAALADLDGNGMLEMLLMHADNPEGANTFRYHVAWNLDANGDPAGGWGFLQNSPPMANNNAGAGAAIGDIDRNGDPDYLFAAIDKDSADKEFNYYIGWNVDSEYGLASSWSALKTAPAIVDNPAGAGAELADLDGNGTLDLILMALQEMDGANRMYFRVGWNLDASGEPESWSMVSQGPFFGGVTTGGGIAAHDINLDGKLDLVMTAMEDRGEDPDGFVARIQNTFQDSMGNAPINLAKYREDAILTGFTVEENHGSQVGVFYSDDVEQTMLANVQLAYEFLRGRETLSDVPARLSGLGISVASDVQSFGHQDEAMAALTGSMTPEALEALSPGESLPIACAFEDKAATVEMGQVQDHVRYQGNTFIVDMADAPVVTSKRIITPWYNTDTKEELNAFDVSSQAGSFAWADGLTGEDQSNFLDLAMAWNTGESDIYRMEEVISPQPDESSKVMSKVELGGKGLASLGRLAVGVHSTYKAAKVLRATTTISNFKLQYGSVSQAKVGSVSKLDRFIKGVGAMGWVFTAGVAMFAFFQIASSHGWSNLGIYSGAMYAALMTAYAIGLWAISCIPIVGGIISGLVALSDLLVGWITGSGWSQRVMEALVDFFVTTDELSRVDLRALGSDVTITDYDGNGLDVGDRIGITSRFQEYVYRYGPGYTNYWQSSYIKPYYALSPGMEEWGGHWEEITDEDWWYPGYYFKRWWNIGVWIELPNENACNNFPFTFRLKSDYKVYYEVCSTGCDVHSTTDTAYSDYSTIYFDVLPKNLEQFLGWSTVIKPLDTDGDGLMDVDQDGDGDPDAEMDSDGQVCTACSPLMWDTDVDGLSDAYEVETTGTNPNNRDSDFDGIPDGVEIIIGSNPNKIYDRDTDNDFLQDLYEYWGWGIFIPLGETSVPMHVYPSLSKSDADGDGLLDYMESLTRTNPWNTDTDGNGIPDSQEPALARCCSPPVTDYGRDQGDLRLPVRPLSSRRADPGEYVSFDVWCYFQNRLLTTGTWETVQYGVTSGAGSGSFWPSGVVNQGNSGFFKSYWGGNLPEEPGVFFIRFYNYWQDLETMPPDEDLPIIGAINSTGGDGWLSTGEDKDGDGLIDLNEYLGWPVAYRDNWGEQSYIATCDPTMKDTDLDGLTDAEEYAAGADPRDKDTDHDCLTDKQEVDLGSNPLSADTDSDGYWDMDEFLAGMSLFSADSDGNGETDNITLGKGIDPLANLPMALQNDTAKTPPNQSVTVDVLANDIFYGDGYPEVTEVSTPGHGQAQTDGENVTYTPDADYTGQDSFAYTASHGGQTAMATVIVTVAEINQAPKAYADSCSVVWNGSVSRLDTLSGTVLSNDTDPEHAPLTAVLTVQPQHGSVTLNNDGTFTYQHDGSATGQDVFNYKANDGENDSNEASVLVKIDLTGDTDSDGLLDWEEAEAGTLVDNPDTDGDGILDGDDPYPLYVMADFDGDGNLTLADLVMGLQILSGCAPSGVQAQYNGPGNDVDGDGLIGQEDIIFLLQTLAGSRN
jgi:VCBS repeat-containing protein